MKLIGKISESLTPSHRTAVEASLTEKIKETDKTELNKPLLIILGEAYEILGQKAPENITPTVKLLRDELKTYFTTYTINEVGIAVKMGVTGKLCDLSTLPMPIVSITNICKFIHLYNEKVRREALHEQRKFEEIETKEMEERKRIKAELELDSEIQVCYENYKSDKETLEHVPTELKACYFRFLWKKSNRKLIPSEISEQIKIIAETKVTSFDELPKLEQKILERNREVSKFNLERDSAVRIEAQAIGLKYLFDNVNDK